MCSMILLALNTFLATPGCVTDDGPATVAAQQWGAYVLEADGYHGVLRTSARRRCSLSERWPARPRKRSSASPGSRTR